MDKVAKTIQDKDIVNLFIMNYYKIQMIINEVNVKDKTLKIQQQ